MEFNLFGLPKELSIMLAIEIVIVFLWIVKILVISKLRLSKPERELFESESYKIPFWDRLILSFSSSLITALYASSAYTFIVAFFTTIIAFQPLDYRILALALILYCIGFAMLAYAWRRSKYLYLEATQEPDTSPF
ncbi:MAG: hypothetical protein DRJ44_03065 [Thermoprotei archaeon]|nr:MAG: hypothetical protein DRJ44_03065 [Thermoprotei archaeon]